MLGEEVFDDTNPDEARDIGSKRFASMSLFDAPLFVPPDPLWAASIRDEVKRQLATCGDVEILVFSYVELLKQAKAFVDFWENNVGPTEDWPISVLGESDEVEACLARRLEKLKIAVNFIEDSHCS
jgi:hypothetical protein